jgi:hypothetical protein
VARSLEDFTRTERMKFLDGDPARVVVLLPNDDSE